MTNGKSNKQKSEFDVSPVLKDLLGAETYYVDTAKCDTLTITQNGVEVIRIDCDGRLFWHKREVETDNDFRAAMLELRDYFMGKHKGA